MGVQVPRKPARRQFEGDEFEGCEITVALDVTFEASEHMNRLQRAAMPNTEEGTETSAPEDTQMKFRELLGFFAENCIVSWNLEDAEGNKLPVSGESFLKFPGWFGLLVINHWKAAIEEVSSVKPPLDDPSKNGSTSEGESVMTEAKSSALSS